MRLTNYGWRAPGNASANKNGTVQTPAAQWRRCLPDRSSSYSDFELLVRSYSFALFVESVPEEIQLWNSV
jgi:hypothetical protein